MGLYTVLCSVCNWRANETLYSGVKFRIGDICYRASESSEIPLVVGNAKSGICYMYGWMVRMPLN